MKVFVSGGAGYIGSVTSHLLVQRGFEVVIYDNLSTGNVKAIPKVSKFIQGEISDYEFLIKSMQGCEAVIHFAGLALVAESFAKPEEYHSINSDSSNTLFEAAIAMGIKKIVVASSCAVYGDKYLRPISENEVEMPINPYGSSKLQMDKHLNRKISENPEIGGISLRFFNVSGALRVGEKWIGENHDPETHVIPNMMKANKESPFQLYGNNYATPDGTCIRDYVHVADIAEAHILALGKVVSGRHDVVNLGTNVGYSLMQLINIFNLTFNKELPFEIRERRQGDPDLLVASNSKASNFLDWKPRLNIERMMLDHHDFLLSKNPRN